MGDTKPLTKARMELEDMYMGIPDDSVNLTFENFGQVKQQYQRQNPNQLKTSPTMKTIQESIDKISTPPRNPSSSPKNLHHHHVHHQHHDSLDSNGHGHGHHGFDDHHLHHHGEHNVQYVHEVEYKSPRSLASPYFDKSNQRPRRPGIPHSNICTICSTYIYIFRHRCLVCGRVYCRDCVAVGMGEMNEGRKCVECLGRRFSPRYIQRAGKVRCLTRYPSSVKQAELKWAEKGPRRSGERVYGDRSYRPRTPIRSPKSPMTPNDNPNQPSLVIGSPYSPFGTPTHNHFPL